MDYDTEIYVVGTKLRQEIPGVESMGARLNSMRNNVTGSGVDEIPGPSYVEACSSYDNVESPGITKIYSSKTLPIDVGSLGLCLEDEVHGASTEISPADDGKARVKLAWSAVSPITNETASSFCRKRRSPGSLPAGVNYSNLRAVIRRRQQRHIRHRSGRTDKYKCLRLILCIFYYMGVSPYRPRGSRKLPTVLVRLLKVLHWILICIAILETLSDFKHRWILFRNGPTMQTLAEMGISLVVAVTRIYTVKVFASMKMKMDQLLEQGPNVAYQESDQGKSLDYKLNGLLALLVGLSISMAFSSVLFGSVPFVDWSFEMRQRIIAYRTNQFIAVWTPHNMENVTLNLWDNNVRSPVSTSMVMFALVGDMVTYIGELYDSITVDFWLGLAYQVHLLQTELKYQVEKEDSILGGTDLELAWDLYLESRNACDNINEIFGSLLKLVHVTNVLRFAEFLLDIMDSNVSAWRVNSFINLLKICVTYYLCKLSADTNGKVQEHVVGHTDAEGCVEMNGVKLKVYAIRMDMDQHQIGLGRGDFLVEETFLIKMLCAAWSVFALFADHLSDRK